MHVKGGCYFATELASSKGQVAVAVCCTVDMRSACDLWLATSSNVQSWFDSDGDSRADRRSRTDDGLG